MTDQITSIRVDYKLVDGYHVFWAEKVPGLYVAHKDPERAYNDVPKVLEKLMKLNAGVICEVKAETSFSDFVKANAKQPAPTRARKATIRKAARVAAPVTYTAHRYAVYACA